MAKAKEKSKPNPLLSAINSIQDENPYLIPESQDSALVDIMTFCDSEEYLDLPHSNFNLFLSQRVILKCFYMGTRGNEDVRLEKKEWEWLHDGIMTAEDELDGIQYETNIQDVINKMMAKEKNPTNSELNFNELHLVLGRRGTKTILASVISSYEAYKLLTINDGDPHAYYGLPDDDLILILNAALSTVQAGLLFEQTEARVRNSKFFKGKIANSTTSEIRFFTKADLRKKASDPSIEIRGSVRIRCGHSNPDTLRGPNAVLILFDELAFYDDSGKVTGQKFYDALQPSLTHFFPYGDGRLVEISSPSVQAGIFYDIYRRSKTDPHILSFQLPTWVSNPTIKYDGDYLSSKRNANPDSFRIEYGAQWAKSGTFGPYFPEGLIQRGLDAGMRVGVVGPHLTRQPGFNYYLHVDPANGGDRYVCVLVAKKFYKNRRGERRSQVQLAGIHVFEPEEGIGLRFNEIDQSVIRIAKSFRCMAVTYDKWESIQSVQLLRSNGINVSSTAFNNSYKQKIYQNITDMLGYPDESELLLYDDPRLILEMKNLKVRPIQRGKKLVTNKHGEVTTDDVIDCLAGATAMASGHVRMPLPEPVTVRMGFL